ncbi:MAG: hypothetical protein JOY70_04340 [Acidisphaera sp.]|nr:hypothetical protein [Acidisphaera sp.]MBV9813172.1 hypothetical protein [Acetobacteraceae bacterium]
MLAGVLALGASGAGAAEILKQEPATGMLVYPNIALVDNGKCPPGQVMQVTGGMNPRRGGGDFKPRERHCVPRPAQ